MPFKSHAINTAGLAIGIPAVIAGYMRTKYGPTVWQDILALRARKNRADDVLRQLMSGITLMDVIEGHAQNTPDKNCILFKDDVYSYADVDSEANRMALFSLHSGVVKPRETVAVLMHNEPAFVMTWLAFNKIGVTTAFLNYNQKAQTLLHCIKTCEAKAVICGRDPELLDELMKIMPDLKALGITIWVHGRLEDVLPGVVSHLDTRGYSGDPIPRDLRMEQKLQDMACYIFTSGTTGMPKPCNVSVQRLFASSFAQAALLGPDDVLYTALPLYHSAGFLVGLIQILRAGGTVAISPHFSASRFWDDVRKYKATEVQYIGETCRYLLAQPPRPDDGKYDHVVRIAIGNGLRPDIWQEFQRRFNIQVIAEFYGATEGNHTTINLDGKIGACGRYSPFLKAWFDVMEFIQCDHDTAEPIRDNTGMCIPVAPGEQGLLVCKITPATPLHGYKASNEANEKKIIRNVKKQGDVYFNTGDMLSYDKEGYLYFGDRLGDTFRWKGENVATTEVAQVLHQYPGIMEANVYGVKVPENLDGRAGMAAIVLSDDSQLDMKKFYQYVTKNLPMYACPKFLRIMPEMHITVTYKHRKTDLVKEGFDPNLVQDPLYFLEPEKEAYVPLDTQVLQKIVSGRAKL
ncbi:long-chain fatty acid transport protein 2-like [Amphiura filiformis]|uniref:long-chain fatty acid transport protein 2-like n=1 Tax=Amphiura filiformis TaxID=82378 RepID=UPI003B222F56